MKTNLMNASMISVATAIVLSMSGCGSSSSSNTTSSQTSTTTNGTASDGYINGATVCYDMNLNNKCDNNASYKEPFTATDANGSYSLKVSATDKQNAKPNAPLLIVGGTDVDTKSALTGTFKAPFDGKSSTATVQITPLTTLVAAMVATSVPVDTAYKQVAKALNLSVADIKANPVQLAKDGNTAVIQAAMTVHRIVTTMAKTADVNNSDIYSHLVTAIKTVADKNESNSSIVTVVTTAAATLPPKAKDAANGASAIANTVSDAIRKYKTNIADAAVVSSHVIKTIIQPEIKRAVESNTTIDVETLEKNATITLDNVKPINLAIKNILSDANITDTNATTIDNIAKNLNVSSSKDVSVEKIITSSDMNSTLKSNLITAFTAQQIKVYVEKHGQIISDSEVKKIAAIPGINYTTLKTMSLADFSKKIKGTGDADLMSLALKLSSPASIASMSDIQKAKALFTSVRTQVNDADTFTKNESTKIDTALNSVTDSVTFAGTVFNTLNDMIGQAIDTNQTTASRLVANEDRNITVSKATASGNVTWAYTIKDINVTTPWSGSFTYTDIGDPDNFDPSNFTTLTAKITGTTPIDVYGTKIAEGKTNSQDVNANLKIDKTKAGAKFHLDAEITNNGDSVSIKDANLIVAYTTKTDKDGTKEPDPKYIEIQNLYINGTVGDYTLDGKLDAPSYVINKIGEAKGFDPETTYYGFGIDARCDNNSTLNASNVKYDGIASDNNNYNSYTSNGTTTTHYWFNWDNMTSESKEINATSSYTGLTCSDGSVAAIDTDWQDSWTDDKFYNSGHLPSELTFDGKLRNNKTNAYLNANIDAKWTDVVDANLSNDSYQPNLDIAVSGVLSMPDSAAMKVALNYVNKGEAKNIKATYVDGDTAVTATTAIPNADSNITVNLSSTTGIEAKIITDNKGNVDYGASTLTNTNGKTIGYFEDRAGVAVVKYPDGTFDSLF